MLWESFWRPYRVNIVKGSIQFVFLNYEKCRGTE